jgi:hypothetical protein
MTIPVFRPLQKRAAGIFLATFFVFSTALHAAIPPAENLLPADTLFLVTVPDCTAMRAGLRQSPQWLFWNDPAMKPFHDKFMAKWNAQFIAPLEKDLGVKVADFADLLRGQLTFAATQNGWDGTDDKKPPGFLLLLDAKDKSSLLQTNLAALRKKWVAAGKSVRTETLHGITFTIVPLSTNDVPAVISRFLPHRLPVQELGKETKPDAPGQIVIGQYQSLLIVGNSTAALEPVAAHLTGGASPMLADNAVFAADKLSQFRDAPLYYGWFNGKALFDVLAKIPPPEPNPDAPSVVPPVPWDKILSASGLMGLKSATFAYREKPDGAQADFSLSVPEAGRTGIFKIIAASPKDANPPAFVPADAVKFWRWRVDGQKSWVELQKMLSNISPQALAQLNSAIDLANMMGQQKDPNFDIRNSLLNNLGDDFMSYQKAPAGKTLAALNNAPSLFLFASPNPEQAAVAVKSIAALIYRAQKMPEPRDFLGKKIYTIPFPSSPAASGVPDALYIAASGGYVAMTRDVSMLETFLRNLGNPVKPLRETAGLAAAAQRAGGAGNGLFGYENQRETMRAAITLVKSQAASGTGGMNSLSVLPKGLQDWMDFSLLPDYDVVAKYFYFSVYGGNVTSDGIYLKFFGPRPPQLR